jgi:hypothetical protein
MGCFHRRTRILCTTKAADISPELSRTPYLYPPWRIHSVLGVTEWGFFVNHGVCALGTALMAASGHSNACRTRRCTCYQEVQGFEIPIIHFPGVQSIERRTCHHCHGAGCLSLSLWPSHQRLFRHLGLCIGDLTPYPRFISHRCNSLGARQ